MYTNPKPHTMRDYAEAPLLSRTNLLFVAALLAGTLAGGLLGVFNARSGLPAGARAASAAPAPASASAPREIAAPRDVADEAQVALHSRGGR